VKRPTPVDKPFDLSPVARTVADARRNNRLVQQAVKVQLPPTQLWMTRFNDHFDKTVEMAFGQQSGPPASSSQVRVLLAYLKGDGYADFRDARGPMGFTQRQAAGKFTQDEASSFIDRLQAAEFDGKPLVVVPTGKLSAVENAMRLMPAEQLAAELRRRGWIVTEP